VRAMVVATTLCLSMATAAIAADGINGTYKGQLTLDHPNEDPVCHPWEVQFEVKNSHFRYCVAGNCNVKFEADVSPDGSFDASSIQAGGNSTPVVLRRMTGRIVGNELTGKFTSNFCSFDIKMKRD
jgi:hypothetical protein